MLELDHGRNERQCSVLQWKIHGLGSCSCRLGLSLRSRVTGAWGASVSMDASSGTDEKDDDMLARGLSLQELRKRTAARKRDRIREHRRRKKEEEEGSGSGTFGGGERRDGSTARGGSRRVAESCVCVRDETDARTPRCPLRSLSKALSSRVAWRRRTTRKASSAATGTGGKRRPAPNGKVLGRNAVRGHWNSRKWPHARRFCAWDVASLLARFGLRTLVCVTIFKLLLRARHRQAGRFSLPPSFQTF